MKSERPLDLAIAPIDALQRIAAAINRPKKRAFGVLKTQNEYAGVVTDQGFEIWERQLRAVHAIGEIRARRGGSRVDVRFVLPPVTRVLLVAFFALYLVVVAGIALRPPDPAITFDEAVISIAGAAVVAALFRGSARRQRLDLQRFLREVFDDDVRRG